MNADINLLFSSPTARILDFKCREHSHTVSPVECVAPFVSDFHFSRIFKKFTARSSHQYLLELRLQHALLLLRNTSLSVSDFKKSKISKVLLRFCAYIE